MPCHGAITIRAGQTIKKLFELKGGEERIKTHENIVAIGPKWGVVG